MNIFEEYWSLLQKFNNKAQEVKEEIKNKTNDVIKQTDIYNEINNATKTLEDVGAKIYDIQENAEELLKNVGTKTEKTSKYLFWSVVGIVGLIIYSKLK